MCQLIDELKWMYPISKKGCMLGVELQLSLARVIASQGEFPDFISVADNTLGQENIAFYDVAYNLAEHTKMLLDHTTPNGYHTSAMQIKHTLQRDCWPDSIAAARCWHSTRASSSEGGVVTDIWLYRNLSFGDLRQSKILQEAHQYVLDIEDLVAISTLSYSPQQLILGSLPYAQGINWRPMKKSGRLWLCYEKYHDDGAWSESWLTAVSDEHYINISFYIPNMRTLKQSRALEHHIRKVMSRLKVRSVNQCVPPESLVAEKDWLCSFPIEHMKDIFAKRAQLEAQSINDPRLASRLQQH